MGTVTKINKLLLKSSGQIKIQWIEGIIGCGKWKDQKYGSFEDRRKKKFIKIIVIDKIKIKKQRNGIEDIWGWNKI